MAVASLPREPAPEYPAIKPGMMGMYIFLASEVMFFGSLFAMYFYLYGSHLTWPPAPPATHPEFYVSWWPIPTINTVVLLSSGGTCHFALEALRHGNRRRFFGLWITTIVLGLGFEFEDDRREDRKSTRLNSSHDQISYAVFCLKKKTERKCATRLL